MYQKDMVLDYFKKKKSGFEELADVYCVNFYTKH